MEATKSATFIVPAPSQPVATATTTRIVAASSSNIKKRPLEAITPLQNSPYYKMRAIVRDLRPNFLEVLQTPDFRNGKAAKEIREKMNIFMRLYKEMMGERTNTIETNQKVSNERLDVNEVVQQEHVVPLRDNNAQSKRIHPTTVSVVQNQQQATEDGRLEGTYVVGGSAFGWNFVMFPGNTTPDYYGRTKEEFKAAVVKSD